jgi:hypothetical protein
MCNLPEDQIYVDHDHDPLDQNDHNHEELDPICRMRHTSFAVENESDETARENGENARENGASH